MAPCCQASPPTAEAPAEAPAGTDAASSHAHTLVPRRGARRGLAADAGHHRVRVRRRATSGMHLEVQVVRPAARIAGVAHLRDHGSGGDTLAVMCEVRRIVGVVVVDAVAADGASPVLAIIGDIDPYTPPADVADLEAVPGVTVRHYPAAEHGFVHDPARPSHRAADAADAWSAMARFLTARSTD